MSLFQTQFLNQNLFNYRLICQSTDFKSKFYSTVVECLVVFYSKVYIWTIKVTICVKPQFRNSCHGLTTIKAFVRNQPLLLLVGERMLRQRRPSALVIHEKSKRASKRSFSQTFVKLELVFITAAAHSFFFHCELYSSDGWTLICCGV